MVSDHGLGKGPDHGVGVDPETVTFAFPDRKNRAILCGGAAKM